MSRLRLGQGVKLLYDAFPYQRHGVRRGAVSWVSPASVSVDGHPAFRTLVDIADDAIRIDSQPRPLTPGMGGRAEVVVARRALVSYAFEPIRQLRESLAEDIGNTKAGPHHAVPPAETQAPREPRGPPRPTADPACGWACACGDRGPATGASSRTG